MTPRPSPPPDLTTASGSGRVGVPLAAGALERAFADRLGALLDVTDAGLLAAAALAAAAPRGGHVCVELDAVVRVPDDAAELSGGRVAFDVDPPDADAWAAALLASPLARGPDDPDVTPLVVDGHRCYLDRYWRHELALRDALVARTTGVDPRVDPDELAPVLDAVASGGPPADGGPDRQRLAVANALLRPFSLVTGGPGTGKTHTVVSVLAAALELAVRGAGTVPRIALAAPTGKAAARMEEAVREAVGARGLPAHLHTPLVGLRATTLHRLLGFRLDTPTAFRHDARTPLPYDLVVVDEASMVSLAMMRRLVEAVAPDAQLVLVGDRDQLASVEAGAVLGDVCGPATGTGRASLRLSAAWAAVLARAVQTDVAAHADVRAVTGVWDAIVQLERTHRFDEGSGIGAVARAVRDPVAASSVVDLLEAGGAAEGAPALFHDDVALLAPVDGGLPPSVRDLVLEPAGSVVRAAVAGDGPAALAALDELRLLCATRRGPLGVEGVTRQVERWLARGEVGGDVVVGGSYVGRPVLVTRNDPDLGLVNGDVGVTLLRDGRQVVVFPGVGDDVREVAAVRLPPHETVWAMTIHKAQGSQYRHAVVVLPDRDNRVLSRELLYTGVTRASERLTVVGTPDVVRAAVGRPVRRATGLADRLWPEG